MANLVSVERASLALGTAHVLDEVSLGVLGGDRIGVVGRNGGGKTTLLRVLAGQPRGRLRPGDPRRRRRASACSPRTTPSTPAPRCARPCSATCPSTSGPATRASATSSTGLLGGHRRRGRRRPRRARRAAVRWRAPAARAGRAARVQDPDLLLLDEPTNHLDVEGVAWLAEHLVRHRARPDNALVAITHDRWFLDAVATDHLGGRRRQGQRVRRRLRGLRAGEGRARADGGRHRRAPRQPAAQGAGLAAPRAAGADLASRSSASTRPTPSSPTSRRPRDDVELMRFATTRLGKDVVDLVDATGRPWATALLLDRRHLAARAGRAGRHRRRQRRGQVDAAARHRRASCR